MNARTCKKLLQSGRGYSWLTVRVPQNIAGPRRHKPSFGEPRGTEGYWQEDLGDGRFRITVISEIYTSGDPTKRAREGMPTIFHPKRISHWTDEEGVVFEKWCFWRAVTYTLTKDKLHSGDRQQPDGEPDHAKVEEYIAWRKWYSALLGETGSTGQPILDRIRTAGSFFVKRRRAYFDKRGDLIYVLPVRTRHAKYLCTDVAATVRYAKQRGQPLRVLRGSP